MELNGILCVWSIKMLRIQYVVFITHIRLESASFLSPLVRDTKYFIACRFYPSVLWIFINTLSGVFSVVVTRVA